MAIERRCCGIELRECHNGARAPSRKAAQSLTAFAIAVTVEHRQQGLERVSLTNRCVSQLRVDGHRAVAEELRQGELHITELCAEGAGDGGCWGDVGEGGVFDGECDGDAAADAFAEGGVA